MTWLQQLFKRRLTWNTITEYTSKNGESLTNQEAAILDTAICPDCGNPLLKGPEGGGSTNLYCSNEDCGSKYNAAFGHKWGERINDSKGRMVLIEENKP